MVGQKGLAAQILTAVSRRGPLHEKPSDEYRTVFNVTNYQPIEFGVPNTEDMQPPLNVLLRMNAFSWHSHGKLSFEAVAIINEESMI